MSDVGMLMLDVCKPYHVNYYAEIDASCGRYFLLK